MKPITVLSLFDGASCAAIALHKCGFKVSDYYSSEIKKCALVNAVAVDDYMHHNNNPEYKRIELGDITKIDFTKLHGKIDLLCAGFPCQDFSSLNKEQKGLKGEKSSLFYEVIRAIKECAPRHIFLENIKKSMKSAPEIINAIKDVGIEAQFIYSNATDFGAIYRKRVFFSDFIPIIYQLPKKNLQTAKDYGTFLIAARDYTTGRPIAELLDENKKINCLTRANAQFNFHYIAMPKENRYSFQYSILKHKETPLPPDGYQWEQLPGKMMCDLHDYPFEICENAKISRNQIQDLMGDGWHCGQAAYFLQYLNQVLE